MYLFRLLLSSQVVFADVATVMSKINRVIINPIVLFLFAVAVLMLVVGFVEFLANPENEESRDKGKQHMLWGVIGIFIMISVFGIMRLLIDTLGFTAPNGGAIDLQN